MTKVRGTQGDNEKEFTGVVGCLSIFTLLTKYESLAESIEP